MKRIWCLLVLPLLAAFFSLTACDDGGDKKSDSSVVTIAHTGMMLNNEIGTTDEAHYMMLYLADDIKRAGTIEAIRFKRGEDMAAESTCSDMSINIGHTSATSLDATFSNNYSGSLQTALDHAAIIVPAGAAGNFFTFTLSEPFIYNGSDNLIIDISRAAEASQSIKVVAHGADPAYNGVCFANDVSNISGTAIGFVVDIQLVFSKE